jgi:hypothetical protein
MDRTTIAPDEWAKYLEEFSSRNRGRRARFEAFAEDSVMEEDEEAVFESVSAEGDRFTVQRVIRTRGEQPIADELTGIRGIAVQHDWDGSDNTIEFTDDRGDLAILHFESTVDGEN